MPAPSLASLPPTPQRRIISIGSVLGGLVATILLFPLLAVGAIVSDLLRGVRSFRYARLGLFITNILMIETGGILSAGYLWVRSGFGRGVSSPKSRQRHSNLQYWYTSSLLQSARTFCGLEIEIEGLEHGRQGNAIVLGRHCSLVDALLPSSVFGQFDHQIKYVLAGGLQWAPNIDLVSGRLDNTFVNRSEAQGEKDLDQLRDMASRLTENSVAAIFPEGSFFTEERRAKVLRRVAERRPNELARAQALRYVLPPQTAGTFALFDGAPTADVILMGHVGFESLSTLADIRDSVPSTTPVKMKLWRFARADIPVDSEQRLDWLYERWEQLDDWIDDNR